MRTSAIIFAFASSLIAVPAAAGPTEEATAFVTSVMDKFNGGDANSFVAAHQDDALIVDEFGAHIWSGPGSVKRWIDDYAKDSKDQQITGGRVDYGMPLKATSDGSTAYIVLPTTYRFQQRGANMSAPGSMTFVLKKTGDAWKIASWTYAGATATAERTDK